MPLTVVTGANRGIGLELVTQSLALGHDVLALCRTSSKELHATGAEVVEGVDVAHPDVGARVREATSGRPVDRLLLNAGILSSQGLDDLDLDVVRRQLEVNAVAPLAIVHAVLPQLGRGAAVVLVTSRMGSIADNGSGGYYGYRMSKAALNAAGKSLALDLAPRGVHVAIVHPGFVRTGMTGGAGTSDAGEAAQGILARAAAVDAKTSGTFWHANGDVLPW